MKFSTIIQVVYILMNDECTSTFLFMFNELRKQAMTLNSTTIITDYEDLEILVLVQVNSNVVQKAYRI